MISNTAQTNTFVKGMNMDSDILYLEDSQYRYSENIRVLTNTDGTTGSIQNIEGTLELNITLPENEEIIGTTTINDIGVVITKLNNGYNNIYRIDKDDAEFNQVLVLSAKLNLCVNADARLSIVANYEDKDNIKIYFTDGESNIKVVNIMDMQYSNVDVNPSTFDITPGAFLKPFKFAGNGTGNLPSGKVQYCYQLFNTYGSETITSPLSPLVHLTNSDTFQNSQIYQGTLSKDSTNKSCIITIDNQTTNFNRIRIIRILYTDNNSIPKISIIDELNIDQKISNFIYNDSGNSELSELTLEEFNNLYIRQFTAKTLAKLDNRLFAANITDYTWDVDDYDTRAYRLSEGGWLYLSSNKENDNIWMKITDRNQFKDIPLDHDCINPYNNKQDISGGGSQENGKYVYSANFWNGVRTIGGSGLNIDYNFTITLMALSDAQQSEFRMDNNTSMNVSPIYYNGTGVKSIATCEPNSDVVYKDGYDTVYITNESDNTQRIPNYADPGIAANLCGYRRDEVYRFGIIFYNKNGNNSPVHWIGDIRMPHASEVPIIKQEQHRLYANVLGIKFEVRNLPEDVEAYEIVRCQLNNEDKTILTQCIGQLIYNYKVNEAGGFAGTGSDIESSVEYRPFSFPTGCVKNVYIRRMRDDFPKRSWIETNYSENHIRIISPEISVAQESFLDLMSNNTYFDYLYRYLSLIDNTNLKMAVSDSIASDSRVTAGANYILQNDGSIDQVDIDYNCTAITTISDSQVNTIMLQGENENSETVYYNGNIYKYNYIYLHDINNDEQLSIEDYKYPINIEYNQVTNLSPYKVSVGDIQYTNFAMSFFTSADTNTYQKAMGACGPCLIIKTNKNISKAFFQRDEDIKLTSYMKNSDQIGCAPVFNIKKVNSNQYGGNTYSARTNNYYITTNAFNTKENKSLLVFGGDTYISILDYPHMMTFQGNDVNDYIYCTRYIGMYIPFESEINLSLLNGDQVHTTNGNLYFNTHTQLQPTQIGNYYVQDEPYYAYNDAYSSEQTAKQYIPKSLYSKNNVNYGNRIIVSQAKTANEVIDNFTKFLPADYLDVDSGYGQITNIYTFNNKLFYWQQNAFGMASVNERSLINDNNVGTLQLGTGGILDRYYYITTMNGSNIYSDNSITNSDSVLYWVDRNKKEICAYDNQIHLLSKEKLIQSFMNTNEDSDVYGFFDKKYNEIWFRFKDKSLIFNEQLGCFTSFYTIPFDYTLKFSDIIILLDDNKYLQLYGQPTLINPSSIEFVINKDYQYTKVYDNIRFPGYLTDKNIITNINLNTNNQHTQLDNPIFDIREDTYRISIPRAENSESDMSFPARMRGKYMICQYTFDNKENSKFTIPYITTTYRYSLV